MHRRNTKLSFKSVVSALTAALLLAASVSTQTTSPTHPGRPTITSEAHQPAANGARVARPYRLRDLIFGEGLSSEAKERHYDQPKIPRPEGDKPDGAGVPTETRIKKGFKVDAQQSNASGPQAADPNHTIVVHSTEDDGPGTLRHALAIASDGDKINIVAIGTITLTSGELVVDKSLTIRGPGKANAGVNGNGTSRVFHVMPGTTVSIEGLTITNGMASGAFPANAGGGIFSDHAILTVSSCTISGNSARYGGGIFSNSLGGGSASLKVNDTTVSKNSGSYGGGIFSGGGFFGADPSGDATLKVNDSRVINNSSWFGGGIFNDGFSGSASATINNSAVNDNSVKFNGFVAGGGGIYNNGDSGVATLTLTNSTVSGNVAGTFVEDPDDGEEHPYEPGNGGGIYNDGVASVRPGNAQVTVANTTVSGNAAFGIFPGSRGGGIYNVGSDLGRAAVTANDSNFNDNRADEGGGGLCNIEFSGDARMSLTGSSVNGNISRSTGGIVNVRFISESYPDTPGNAHVTLANTVIRRNSGFEGILNSGATLKISGCDVSNNLGAGIVTLALALPADATISDSFITRNRSSSEGGGIVNYANGGGVSTLKIADSIIRENYASISGGGIANLAALGAATLTLDRSTVSDNHAVTGGGLLNYGAGTATATITNCTLSGNSTQGELPPGGFLDGGGGGVLNGGVAATVDLTNCTVSGNSTHRTGGGIGNYAEGFNGLSRVTLNNCTLSGNSAGEGGNNIWNRLNTEQPPPPSCPPDCPPPPCPGCPPPPPEPPPPRSNATVDFSHTIFNGGYPGENILNLSGTVLSSGYNLSSDAAGGDGSYGPGGFLNATGDIRNTDPQLGPLQNNGGPTLTHALPLDSTAINAGDPTFDPGAFTPSLLYDQRSGPELPRVVNGRVDIGAFEFNNFAAVGSRIISLSSNRKSQIENFGNVRVDKPKWPVSKFSHTKTVCPTEQVPTRPFE